MLDHVCVFSKGGTVLWSQSFVRLRGQPINDLISTVYLEERVAEDSYVKDDYKIKWRIRADLDLIFVVVFQKILTLPYIDALLDSFEAEFLSKYDIDSTNSGEIAANASYDFEEDFKGLMRDAELKSLEEKQRSRHSAPRRFEQTEKFSKTKRGMDVRTQSKDQDSPVLTDGFDGDVSSNTEPESGYNIDQDGDGDGNGGNEGDDVNVLENEGEREKHIQRKKRLNKASPAIGPAGRRRGRGKHHGKGKGGLGMGMGLSEQMHALGLKDPNSNHPSSASASASSRKTARVWDDGKLTSEEVSRLNKSTDQSTAQDALDAAVERQREANANAGIGSVNANGNGNGKVRFDDDYDNDDSYGSSDSDEGGSEEERDGYDASASEAETGRGRKQQKAKMKMRLEKETEKEKEKEGLFSLFGSIVGTKPLSRSDLEGVMSTFRDHLVEKNVAIEIAEKLCESILVSLVGKKVPTFSTLSVLVKKSLEEALIRILTPKRNIDVLRGIQETRRKKRPYVIVFVGVNGVGKSTSLSKVAFWLQQNGQKVRIAACDTFRSGAVEQLRVHAQCLDIPLFERGYGKDSSSIAAEAINEAKIEGDDVVLIDTAGRMQSNEPLMRALTKLVSVNNPDLILFVGEALVGNDGVDQLTKFDQAMADNSDISTLNEAPRLLDGIMLTKCDTIDDKIGAALSMVYSTGHPILFMGVGQTYTDLRRFNVKTVVRTLLK